MILGDEIVDETDGLVDVNNPAAIMARHSVKRLVDEHLGLDKVRAVATHLWINHPEAVGLVSDRRLWELLAVVPVVYLLQPP